MSFLQEAKEKASQVARDAADASGKAAGAVAANAAGPARWSSGSTRVSSPT